LYELSAVGDVTSASDCLCAVVVCVFDVTSASDSGCAADVCVCLCADDTKRFKTTNFTSSPSVARLWSVVCAASDGIQPNHKTLFSQLSNITPIGLSLDFVFCSFLLIFWLS